jgi:putative sterol carrier protein
MTQEQPLPNTVKEVMDGMSGAFQPDKAAGVTATIQFKFTGAEEGNYVVKVADGKCAVEEGETDSATVTINSPSDVWLKISRRELDGATAFMSGQFTFTGDMGVLMQMGSWFGQG